MDKSYKNLLQEHFQKNKLQLPSYETIRIDEGTDNEPIWKSTVTLMNDKSYGGISKTKTDAEMSAAKNAYEYLILNGSGIGTRQNTTSSVPRLQKTKNLTDININNYKRILLVDGENCDLEIERVDSNILVLIFVSKNTTKNLVFRLQHNNPNCYVFISNSVGRDAADHLLTFYAGKLSVLYENIECYVLTKDHYGEFLEKFMNNCKFICSIDEIKSDDE